MTEWDFSGLRAMYINCTLKKSPELSHTAGLIDASAAIMRKHGVDVEVLRAIDHPIATGVYPDMREYGWAEDAWPDILSAGARRGHPRRCRADLAGRQLEHHQADHRAALCAVRDAQRQRPVRVLRARRRLPDHGQRRRDQALRHERPLQPAAHRLHDSSPMPMPAGSVRQGQARRTSTPAVGDRRTTSPTGTRPS